MAPQDKPPFVDSPHWNVGFGADPWFQRSFRSKWPQRAAKVVTVVVVVGLVCFLLGLGIGRAAAAPPPSGAHARAGRCVDMQQQTCRRRAAGWAARSFRDGRMGHANHRTAWFFRHPDVARRVIHRMVVRKVARLESLGTAPRTLRSARYYTRKLWRGSTCDGQGVYSPYSYGFDLCEYAGPSPLTTKQQIQNAGSLVLCGAGVALGWWNGAGAAVIAVGATSCGWGLWLGMDGGGGRPETAAAQPASTGRPVGDQATGQSEG